LRCSSTRRSKRGISQLTPTYSPSQRSTPFTVLSPSRLNVPTAVCRLECGRARRGRERTSTANRFRLAQAVPHVILRVDIRTGNFGVRVYAQASRTHLRSNTRGTWSHTHRQAQSLPIGMWKILNPNPHPALPSGSGAPGVILPSFSELLRSIQDLPPVAPVITTTVWPRVIPPLRLPSHSKAGPLAHTGKPSVSSFPPTLPHGQAQTCAQTTVRISSLRSFQATTPLAGRRSSNITVQRPAGPPSYVAAGSPAQAIAKPIPSTPWINANVAAGKPPTSYIYFTPLRPRGDANLSAQTTVKPPASRSPRRAPLVQNRLLTPSTDRPPVPRFHQERQDGGIAHRNNVNKGQALRAAPRPQVRSGGERNPA
jgi:hypothetical protein